jgi:hypothetical protein
MSIVHATREAFRTQKEHPALHFVGYFCPPWIRIRIANPEPGTLLNPDPNPQHWEKPTL